MLIYIISKSGHPLMPTERINHVRRLLDKGKARIVSKEPYTVQLKYDTDEVTQPLHGGIDPGRTNIGEAVVNDKGEVVYKAHVTTRNKDIPELMENRKKHRQASRRGERLRRKRRAKENGTVKEFKNGRIIPGCEKPTMLRDIINTESRFANRKRPRGWLTPTTRQLVQTHVNMVRKICAILPVTDWTMEYNKFAFMELEDGNIRGVDYQNGRLKDFSNKKAYIYSLQNGKCACCGRPIEHYHHLVPRSKGGSDTPENLTGLCKSCHDKVHSGDISLKEQGLKKKYNAISVLNQAVPYIAEELISMFGDHVSFCSGYETSLIRENLSISKDHPEDAVCISLYGSGAEKLTDRAETYEVQQFRRHDRARVKAQKERTYYLNGKKVCKNRHKRTDQKEDSLAEFRQNNPSDVGRLTVKKSTRSYNDTERDLPGMEVIYNGKRYIAQGKHNKRYTLYGLKGAGVSYKDYMIVRKNQGLVYM